MYTFIPYPYLYLYPYQYYGVCLYCVSISMSVSIWVLRSVECLHIPYRPTLHIHVNICIYMDITKCGVIIWYLFWIGLFWYLKHVTFIICKHGAISVFIWILWNVKCLHTPCRSILCINIHVCIYMHIMECGVSPCFMWTFTAYLYPPLFSYHQLLFRSLAL